MDNDNIISFGDFKEKKSLKKQSPTNIGQNGPTYFMMLGNEQTGSTKFRFGGAFVRDFIRRMDNIKEDLTQQVVISHDLTLKTLKEEANDPTEYVNIYLSKQTILGVIDLLMDEFSFDALFENESLATQAGMIIGVAIVSFYEYEDLVKMQHEKWIDCDLEVLENIFKKIKGTDE